MCGCGCIIISKGGDRMKIVKLKCKKCGSQQILFRRTDKKYWCRVCGFEWKKTDILRRKASARR